MAPDPTSLADLTPDPANARRHTPRNVGTIVDALHEVGAARSIVVDEDGVVLAGNATVEAAADRGGQEGHPTPKPLGVWTWLVERVTTRTGQVVFDPFCGAGTTLVAAEQSGRTGVGLEIDPGYVAVGLERLAGMGLDVRRG